MKRAVDLPGCLLVFALLAFALVVGLHIAGCSSSTSGAPACTQAQRDALIALYDQAGAKVIDSGQCDKYTKVEDCPAYRVIEEHFAIAETAMCRRK